MQQWHQYKYQQNTIFPNTPDLVQIVSKVEEFENKCCDIPETKDNVINVERFCSIGFDKLLVQPHDDEMTKLNYKYALSFTCSAELLGYRVICIYDNDYKVAYESRPSHPILNAKGEVEVNLDKDENPPIPANTELPLYFNVHGKQKGLPMNIGIEIEIEFEKKFLKSLYVDKNWKKRPTYHVNYIQN